MLGSSSTLSIIPHVQKGVQYDALKDFTSIALVASYPYYLAVPADSHFKTFDDLIAYGRDKSHQLSYASAGTGADNHLAGERSEARRVGKEWVSTGRLRWSPYNSKTKKDKRNNK